MEPSPDHPAVTAFSTVLIANRGEIALRLIRAVHTLSLRAVAVFTPDDATSPHIRQADIAHPLPPAAYTDPAAIIAAARATGAGAVLPGYGFLSEDPDAADCIIAAGLVWLGPRPDTIRLFGLKHTARAAAVAAAVPVAPGSGVVASPDDAVAAARAVGLPALIKASAGGGGMGQAVVRTLDDVPRLFATASAQADALFSTPDVFVERFVQNARHIEVQVFGDGEGGVVALSDRECSAQRRRQKVVEEAPAPSLPDKVRKEMQDAAVNLCAKHNYRSAGTVEFVVDADSHEWFFLEVNTRLQVEHGITEMVLGVDLPVAMILLGAGHKVMPMLSAHTEPKGFAIQARIYAENPMKDYMPSSGAVSQMVWPDDDIAQVSLPPRTKLRVDRWAERGVVVSGSYDPLLGKVMAWGRTRPLAVLALQAALKATTIRGVDANVAMLQQIINHKSFRIGMYTTRLLSTIVPTDRAVEVVKPGLQSSLQDYPGRVGYWNIGVSPSGPMDAYAMGMANALVGNVLEACALEMTVSGPSLLFYSETVVALAGGNFPAFLDGGRPVPLWTPFVVSAGSTLSIGNCRMRNSGEANETGGKILYLAVRGGFDAPKYLGSASTFPTGKFGGLKGNFLSAGDFLPVGQCLLSEFGAVEMDELPVRWPIGKSLDPRLIPEYGREEWTVAAMKGPHATEDFLHNDSLEDIWNTTYEVHHATNRMGARLIGPTPKWTRADGGSAGLHPSNLHDYTYAPGAVNFSGNTPIVLMLDGPSLGGFVCPITVATSDLWKVAQAAPGETVRFKQVNFEQASAAAHAVEEAWDCVRYHDMKQLEELVSTWLPWWTDSSAQVDENAILASLDPAKGDSAEIKVCYRTSGDEHVLVEYGEIDFDLAYRLRVHTLMEVVKQKACIKELCPGVRSVLIRYDRKQIHATELVDMLTSLENGVLGHVEDVQVPSRVLELPLAFDDQWTIEAQARYLRSVRPDAPYMPSNVEFIRRINGLSSISKVKDIMLSAEYMVLGLGDVYLGAPCAVPVDPRHRMVTSKYNPARTYTPEGAVGIGGAYMCIYGMDSPGGYQLCGRTLPIWDSYGSVPEECRGAPKDVPWLLRFFDRVSFFPVSDEELVELRARYKKGDYPIKIREEKFSYKAHLQFLKRNSESIEEFERQRDAAYSEERQRWEKEGEGASNAAAKHASANSVPTREAPNSKSTNGAGENVVRVTGGVSANVWAVHATVGEAVSQGDSLLTLESMKVEIEVSAPTSGVIQRIPVKKGQPVGPDVVLCIIEAGDADDRDVRLSSLSTRYELRLASFESVALRAQARLPCQASPVSGDLLRSAAAEAEQARENGAYVPLFGAPFVSLGTSACLPTVCAAGAVRVADISGTDSVAVVAQAIRDGAASFALLAHGKPLVASGVATLTASDGLIDGSLTVMAHNAEEAGRVLGVCVGGRGKFEGQARLADRSAQRFGQPRAARLRVGVKQNAQSGGAVDVATSALEFDGHTIVKTSIDSLARMGEITSQGGNGTEQSTARGSGWWRRVLQHDVWDKADTLLLDGKEAVADILMDNVADLELCCLSFGGMVLLAPALHEDALLTIANVAV